MDEGLEGHLSDPDSANRQSDSSKPGAESALLARDVLTVSAGTPMSDQSSGFFDSSSEQTGSPRSVAVVSPTKNDKSVQASSPIWHSPGEGGGSDSIYDARNECPCFSFEICAGCGIVFGSMNRTETPRKTVTVRKQRSVSPSPERRTVSFDTTTKVARKSRPQSPKSREKPPPKTTIVKERAAFFEEKTPKKKASEKETPKRRERAVEQITPPPPPPEKFFSLESAEDETADEIADNAADEDSADEIIDDSFTTKTPRKSSKTVDEIADNAADEDSADEIIEDSFTTKTPRKSSKTVVRRQAQKPLKKTETKEKKTKAKKTPVKKTSEKKTPPVTKIAKRQAASRTRSISSRSKSISKNGKPISRCGSVIPCYCQRCGRNVIAVADERCQETCGQA